MHIINLTDISVPPNRQRKEFNVQKLNDLKDSISAIGLLNPPTFIKNDAGIYVLVAGERRLRAIKSLAEEEKSFVCNSTIINPGQLPVLLLQHTDKLSRTRAELEENLIREDLTWTERTAALAAFHALRTADNPSITNTAIATELAEKRASGPEPVTENQVTAQRHALRRAVVIAEHLSDPTIANARTEAEAYQLVLKKESEAYEAELIRRKAKGVKNSLRCEIRHGDSIEIMKQLDDNQFDLILTDPPYGIGADSGSGYRNRTVLHHNYDDSPANARAILETLLVEGWRLCKLQANIVIFTDIKHFAWLYENSTRIGWMPWRHPIIWQKSISEGLVPWGKSGFCHTYDIAFYATKGRRGTNRTNPDVLTYSRVGRSERVYAAEKPVPLLQNLIDLMTNPGDSIFDPCAGSGSTMVAAKSLGRHSLGIEIDKAVCDLATVRIEKGDENVDFSALNARLKNDSAPDGDLPPEGLGLVEL